MTCDMFAGIQRDFSDRSSLPPLSVPPCKLFLPFDVMLLRLILA